MRILQSILLLLFLSDVAFLSYYIGKGEKPVRKPRDLAWSIVLDLLIVTAIFLWWEV